MELRESDTLQNKIDLPSIGKNVIFCKEKKNCFFSIEAVETKLKPLRVPFLQAARCRNVPCLALERVVCAQRWRKLVRAPRRREPEGNPASLAGQPFCISGAPLIIPTSSTPTPEHFRLSCYTQPPGQLPSGWEKRSEG